MNYQYCRLFIQLITVICVLKVLYMAVRYRDSGYQNIIYLDS